GLNRAHLQFAGFVLEPSIQLHHGERLDDRFRTVSGVEDDGVFRCPSTKLVGFHDDAVPDFIEGFHHDAGYAPRYEDAEVDRGALEFGYPLLDGRYRLI